jgi:hypothetical protein
MKEGKATQEKTRQDKTTHAQQKAKQEQTRQGKTWNRWT